MTKSMSGALEDYRSIWNRKLALRRVYSDFYDRITAACQFGRTLEIGGGIGNLKERLVNVITTDIQLAPWLDCVTDAQNLPFAANSMTNIVMVDVLHHIEYPGAFFKEAARVLRPGGSVIMVEPAVTLGSTLFYRFLHHEPVIMSADPLKLGKPDPNRDPYISNQAIPTLIATRDRAQFQSLFPQLRVKRVGWFSFVVYPLTGGFKPWSLISDAWAQRIMRVERILEPFVGRAFAFRMMMVIEKPAVREVVPLCGTDWRLG